MKKQEFTSIIETTFYNVKQLTKTKGEEYSRDEDQLSNFKRSAADARISKEQVWQVFFNKHVDSIKSFVQNGHVLSEESIYGRIDDAILYLILLKAIVREDETTE